MEKYKSFHFSPDNNRSMLMPRIPRGAAYTPPPRHAGRELFEPVPDKLLDGKDPYFQLNTGLTAKKITINGRERNYGVYVPEQMTSKGAALLVFPDSGIRAEEWIDQDNWKALAEEFHTALLILESSNWDKNVLDQEFDYAWNVVQLEFGQRPTVDICESFIYPIGLGDGAYIAAAFALTYSATFPAFAADGDCSLDPELLQVLRSLPSDGIVSRKKTEIAISGFLIDRSGRAEETFSYMKEILRAEEAGLKNRYGKVFLERPRRGAYFVNEQPISQVWLAEHRSTETLTREEWNRAMVEFVLRFARWGGFGNNHLRPKRTRSDIGLERVYQEINGLPRYWDIFVPSSYRPGDGRTYPLVVAIHGMSCNSQYFAETSDWHRLAEERGFFVCYASAFPHNDGLTKFPIPHWALGAMGLPEKDELSYFRRMLDYMEETYPIDRKRIYAAGHSNGSQMTQKLAREMPERFAAFGPTGALDGWDPKQVKEIPGNLQRPVWFMMGQYDICDSDPGEGSIARATLEAYCRVNGVKPQYHNWYDNGNYHTLVMYDDKHVPAVCYTIIRDCPHTYTAEMAQLTWDLFFCHFEREEDGSVSYHG